LSLQVQVGERPENLEQGIVSQEISGWRGMDVDDLTSDKVRGFRIEENKGVVVVNVEPNSPADEAGIIVGDVVLEINRQPVKNLQDYQKITQGSKGNCLVKTSRGFFLVKGD